MTGLSAAFAMLPGEGTGFAFRRSSSSSRWSLA